MSGVSDQQGAAALAWQLASQKGDIDVDRDVLTAPPWIVCPSFFPKGENRESWAAESATWDTDRLQRAASDIDRLDRAISVVQQVT
jgi:hypothetical protein